MLWYRGYGGRKYERRSCEAAEKREPDTRHHCDIRENRISIDFHVIVSYGVSISAVADNLIESVKYRVEEFTGMEIEKINIFVEGVRVID